MSQSELIVLGERIQKLGASVEIVGRWLWASFPVKPDDEVRSALKALHFHWNWKRGVWQFAGVPCRQSPASSFEIRSKYGAVALEEERGA